MATQLPRLNPSPPTGNTRRASGSLLSCQPGDPVMGLQSTSLSPAGILTAAFPAHQRSALRTGDQPVFPPDRQRLLAYAADDADNSRITQRAAGVPGSIAAQPRMRQLAGDVPAGARNGCLNRGPGPRVRPEKCCRRRADGDLLRLRMTRSNDRLCGSSRARDVRGADMQRRDLHRRR